MEMSGLIVRKQEMMSLWQDDKKTPVTLLKVVPQEIIRYKTQDKDGYDAVVVGAEKKQLNKEKGIKEKFSYITEFRVSKDFMESYSVGSVLDAGLLEGIEKVRLKGHSKGKGFQGIIKRFGFNEGPKTHGSRHVREMGSVGGMKPHRVIKGKAMPGRMGNNTTTLKRSQIVDMFNFDEESLVAVKGSVPGAYNGILSLYV